MRQQCKAIIIGTSLTGKTTLIKYLRKTSSLPIQEIDEELVQLNNGIYPKEDNYKNTVLVPQIKTKILASKSVLFFTNAHYFTPQDLQKARHKGFKIVQLFVGKEELERRNKKRMASEGYEDHSQWFDSMLEYQKEIKEQGLVDKTIKTDKLVKKIAQELVDFLGV